MTLSLPPSPLEKATEEIQEKIDEAVEEIREEVSTTDGVTIDPKCVDEIVSKVTDSLYDKVKVLITELMEAIDDAEEIAAATVETPPSNPEPASAATTTEEPPEDDVRPRNSHRLFRRPLKKD